ncbi:predicted protein [Naegleria gruberi]|uniref:Predicted protein n=1 Tax=Naegleria gruberi TaxID=5762 RepID=D2VLX6_NAEGR|nr:uncharacterized protein NAEGRDRAFT_69934 [Naegleria gruberi]EFC42219.1 predicted protein [Naegleria gruberi]|eukprot:XP_002674963.1 predicted protein [Naegleria gruberi strain NEG-M]
MACRNFHQWVLANVKVATLDFKDNSEDVIYECARLGAFRKVEKVIMKNCEFKLKKLFENHAQEWLALCCDLNCSDFDSLYKFKDFETFSLNRAGNDWTSYRRISQFDKLRVLKLIGCGFQGPSTDWWFNFLATRKPDLKIVDLSNCQLTWYGLNLVGSISSLESLNVGRYESWEELKPFTKWNMPNLTFLNISGFHISEAVPDICKLTKLQTLKMECGRVQHEKPWKQFAETIFPNLTVLDMSKNSVSVDALKPMHNLTSLNLTKCGINNDHLEKLFNGLLTKIAILDISENDISDLGIFRICLSEYSSTLRSITCIPHKSLLTSVSVKDIVNSPYLQNLTLLNLCGNDIGSAGLKLLSDSNLVKLKVLKLCRNSLSESSMLNFANGNIRNLTDIDFSPDSVPESKFKDAFPLLKTLNRRAIKR